MKVLHCLLSPLLCIFINLDANQIWPMATNDKFAMMFAIMMNHHPLSYAKYKVDEGDDDYDKEDKHSQSSSIDDINGT